MKKQIFTSITLSVLFLLGSFSPVLADIPTVPVAQQPSGQRDKYQTDLFTGGASYNYPISVAKGTNDLTPDISLSYNSSGAHDLTMQVGSGWQLNTDYIQRDVNYTPNDISDDKYKLHFKGSIYDLMYNSSDNLFHTKIESHIKIQQLTSGGQGSTATYWQVTTTDGTVYRFGYNTNSELMCNGQSYEADWDLDQVADTHNNHIYYTYTQNAGLAYLSQIKYNNDQQREVDFNYISNPYQHQAYSQGCSITEVNRLSTIQVKVTNNLVHEYDLTYTTATSNMPELQSITEKGNDGSALPPTSFNYNNESTNWATQASLWDSNNALDADPRNSTMDVRTLDVDGDGRPDVVKATWSGGNDTYQVFKNLGNTWSNQPQTWLNNNPMDAHPSQYWTRLIDVNGDGLPDIVKATSDTWYVWKNTGSGWSTSPTNWASNSQVPGFTQTDNKVALVDVNGDGLPDVVQSLPVSGPNWTWKVYKNTGSSFNTTPELWINNQNVDAANIADPSVTLADVNGDGLPDIVKVINNGGPNNDWTVYLNTGSSWNTNVQTWDNPIDANFDNGNITLTDVNGDGLPDIVKVINDGGPNNDWEVYLNSGHSWAPQSVSWVNGGYIDANSSYGDTIVADVNGDSVSDILRIVNTGGPNNDYRVFANNAHAPELLSDIHNEQGGSIHFDYTQSTSFSNTSLPFNVWVVSKMSVSNGLTNSQQTNDVTTYTYKNGLYNWQNHEFRGFGEVDETDSNGSQKQTFFKQDDGLKGTMYQQKTNDALGNPYIEIDDTWNSTQSNGIYTNSLTSEKKYTYDGAANNPKTTETDYQYDQYGNIIKKSELGDTAVTGDEKYTYYQYTYNPSIWLVNSLSDTYFNDPDDSTKVSETWEYYDGNLGLNDAPTKGDPTKEVKWLNGGTNPITTYQYDTYGNQTQMTDANGHTIQTTYGTNDTTNTYPDSQTNAKNQTTIFNYDLGTGNLLSKTDPNGFTTSYVYDAFGRVTKEIDPYDSLNLPTKSYTYFDNSTAPQGTRTSQLKVSNQSGTLDTYTFIDGLGRTIQTRKPAEDTTKQIVADIFYDATGNPGKQSVPHSDSYSTTYTTPLTGIENTTTTYDAIARPIKIINPQGTYTTTAYDHWKQTDTDENGHQKKKVTDAYNNIIEVDEYNSGQTYTTEYTYDPLNNLIKIVDANTNNFIFTFDTLKRRISETDPDMGTWNYTYDGVDNLLTKTDNRDVITTETYDELNRVTKVHTPHDTDTIYTYDGNNKIGSLTSVTDAAGTVNYAYDNRLRKTQEQRITDGNTWTTTYAYDAANRITTTTKPDGEVVANTFNDQGQIASVSGILNNIDYNALDKIVDQQYANGLTTNFSYNTNDFHLNRIQTGTVQEIGYQYDNVGNVASISDNLLNKTQTFGYDDLDRLLTASESAGYNFAYTYNAIGNLTSVNKNGTEIDYSYGQNAGVHALTSSTEQGPTTTPTPTPSQNNDYTIYDEGLGSGWEDWSWGSTNNDSDTTYPNTGSQDLSWIVNSAYGGINLHNVNGVDTTPYTNLTLSLRATQANQHIQVQFHDASDVAIGNPIPLANYGGDPVIGSYTTYTIPLSILGATNRVITGLIIQDITGTAEPVMYVDTVKLTGNNQAPTPTATPTTTPTNTPTPTPSTTATTIYDESLTSGWQDWSWSATNNFNDTTYPYAGTKDLSWTNNAAYGALYLHNSGGFNSATYDSLTFALRATQAGQQVQVQLYDASDNAIGTPVSVSNYGGDPVAGSYKVYTIPLADLGGANQILHGFILQDRSGSAEPPMYIDSIALLSNSANSYAAQYFSNMTLSGTPTVTRQDPEINFDWGGGSPDPAIPVDGFSARWTKTTNFTAGTYKFSVTADDGVRLYLDNQLVIDKWIDQGATTYTTTQTLTSGDHTIKVEYYENSGGALAQFSYQPDTDLALNKTAVASSLEDPSLPASQAVDGDSSTRWSSGYSDPQWIYVDLGASHSINEVKLNWEAAYATAYQIQVSDDATNWTTIYSTTTGPGGQEDLTGLNGAGRYVRMYGTQRAINAGYSLWDFEVYGQ